tara:strand:+ start:600 stop:1109 length:510 start_codon:yes stop_codon:yes gene_type:complete
MLYKKRGNLTRVDWDSKKPIYKISHKKLHKNGIKFLLIDVDGTLLSRNTKKIPTKVKNWINKSKELFTIYLISNNPSKKRIDMIGKELGIRYKFKALKPSRKVISEVIKPLNLNNKNIAIIGDRILTDVIVGNRCNLYTILVSRLNKKGLPVRFNITLFFEKIISMLIF